MFCNNCGANVPEGSKFCHECGTKVGEIQASAPAQQPQAAPENSFFEEIVIWEGQPSGLMDRAKSAVKVNSVYYKITNHRVVVNSGLIGKKEEEIELSKINDYRVSQSIAQRVLGVGDVVITTYDPSTPKFVFDEIQNPNDVKEILRKAVMEYKQRLGTKQYEMY